MVISLVLISAGRASIAAQNTGGTGSIQSSIMANGMEVILDEIPGSGTVYLGLVFRGGTEAQTSKNAGLLRMLEHFLFRGLATYPGEPEPAGALEALGAMLPSGGTSFDRFGFSFSVNKTVLPQAVDTLAHLFSTLRIETAFQDPVAFQEARDSSLFAIAQSSTDPAVIYEAALYRKMFASAPWRLDLPGAEYIVSSATSEALASFAATWLVPNNAALVVAGDFSAEAARPLIEQAFGSWKRAADPLKTPPTSLPKPGVSRPTLVVYADPSIPSAEAIFEMRYRGPDSGSVHYPTTILWGELVSGEDSKLAAAIRKALPQVSAPRMIVMTYKPTKTVSWFSIAATVSFDAKNNPADMALTFKETVRGTEMYAMKTNPSYFSARSLENAINGILERRMAQLSDPTEAGTLISDGWVLGGTSWIRNWPERVSKIRQKEIAAFADEYFMKNLEIVAVRLNPQDYSTRKKSFDAYGFEQVTPQKAFWWR